MTGYLHALVEDAAREAGCSVAVILGHQRRIEAVRARWRAMRRAYDAGYSLPQIGRVFNRDHSTVLHAVRKCADG
jgi:chromosomal replication initiation ATPase DnaA